MNKKEIAYNTPLEKDDSFADFFNAIYPLSKKATSFIRSMSYPLAIKRGDFLIKPGEKTNHLYLIKKGVIRGFIIEDDKEVTTWINEEKEVVSSIRNLGTDKCSEEYLHAIEDCELTGIAYSAIEYLYNNFPASNRIGRIILEESYRAAEERAFICRINNAYKRYERFMLTQGNLINRIPLKYIASYLNMTIETLSRLRKKSVKMPVG